MTSLTVSDLAAQIAAAVSGDRGLNAPIFPDGLVRFHSKNIAVPFFSISYSVCLLCLLSYSILTCSQLSPI